MQSNVVPKFGSRDLVMHKMTRASDYLRVIYIHIIYTYNIHMTCIYIYIYIV